jgi:hypothetical protein
MPARWHCSLNIASRPDAARLTRFVGVSKLRRAMGHTEANGAVFECAQRPAETLSAAGRTGRRSPFALAPARRFEPIGLCCRRTGLPINTVLPGCRLGGCRLGGWRLGGCRLG